MSTLILEVDDKQKEAICMLADLLNINITEVNADEENNPKALKNALEQVFGLWKDSSIEFEELRKQAWGGRGV